MNHEKAVASTRVATAAGCFIGRVWRENIGPSVVTLRRGRVFDITSKSLPTVRDYCEAESPVAAVAAAKGEDICSVEALLLAQTTDVKILAPIDLQAIKAAGVTFASSMLERVIEEKARQGGMTFGYKMTRHSHQR